MTSWSAAQSARLVELRGGGLKVLVAPDHGGEIRAISRQDGPNVLFWDDWKTPVRASQGGSYGASEQDWLSEWRGGWQELFPNAGGSTTVLGAALGFHGEVSRAPWQVLQQDDTSLTIRAQSRLPLTLTRTMRTDADRAVLYIEEEVVNDSSVPVPFLWGHHPAFEALPGARLDLPPCRAIVPGGFDVRFADLAATNCPWPDALATDGTPIDLSEIPARSTERVVYLTDLEEPWYAMRRPDGETVAVSWDANAYPYLWMWTEIGGVDFPWFGRSRSIALEPASSWPNDGFANAISRGQGHRIGPYGRLSAWVTVALTADPSDPVIGVDQAGHIRTRPSN